MLIKFSTGKCLKQNKTDKTLESDYERKNACVENEASFKQKLKIVQKNIIKRGVG